MKGFLFKVFFGGVLFFMGDIFGKRKWGVLDVLIVFVFNFVKGDLVYLDVGNLCVLSGFKY